VGLRNRLIEEVKNGKSKRRPIGRTGGKPKCHVNGYVEEIARGV